MAQAPASGSTTLSVEDRKRFGLDDPHFHRYMPAAPPGVQQNESTTWAVTRDPEVLWNPNSAPSMARTIAQLQAVGLGNAARMQEMEETERLLQRVRMKG
eukprot:TRINITY_DN24277_c0_g1_i2.p1 TRINITY_DN24277_c0_g1~~TRINITY_DN24277_c0_g1_i2.p1  ORF type:complete len:100 (+),score=21.53 TRINITY_DN24277_c0_g1_i2:133-432(+)